MPTRRSMDERTTSLRSYDHVHHDASQVQFSFTVSCVLQCDIMIRRAEASNPPPEGEGAFIFLRTREEATRHPSASQHQGSGARRQERPPHAAIGAGQTSQWGGTGRVAQSSNRCLSPPTAKTGGGPWRAALEAPPPSRDFTQAQAPKPKGE